MRLSVRVAWGMRRSKRCKGELGWQLLRPATRLSLLVLDGAFGGVDAMKVWRNELELDAGIAQKLF